ncbi:formate dehydrogenase accessory sulfurtransferase FdhD [Flavihumibacter sp. UBA7668]|uniref:formate dehydrogenase accessory sulfurtransferase FdhD n=1 Tax=Flavihumibacter sp. UBA7668 TaxID=1946542 RepID=UPI0025B84025|nr:formate dehydrogenase accessory sulfurtransferase FdhD [Flavihumibacter sp. UBA7668]
MIKTIQIKKFIPGQELQHQQEEKLAIEEPLEISLGSSGEEMPVPVSITMRTPGQDPELATGFLFTEGILKSVDDLQEPAFIQKEENKISILLNGNAQPAIEKLKRNFYTTSSCGVCGKESIEAIRSVRPVQIKHPDNKIPAELFPGLPELLRVSQTTFDATGGIHAAALFHVDGRLLDLKEDIGRHNALDKLIGAAFLKFKKDALPFSLHNTILLLSGRASFELIQKAAMAGIKIVCSIGAPSSLAVETALEFDITFIGFLKQNSFNIYCGAERILT